MKLRLIAAALLAVTTASHGQSADLRVLQVEFENLLGERVTDIYNAGLAKLDASYLVGVERGLTDAKAAGDLKSALSMEAEKKRLTDKEALPADDEQAAPALKKLRGIYRAELVKLDEQRVTNRAALLTPYVAKMKQLEADLTKADRLPEAKAVMDYRQAFIAAGAPVIPVKAGAGVAASKTSTSSLPQHLLGTWEFKILKTPYSGLRTFKADKTFTGVWGKNHESGTWKVDGDKVVLMFEKSPDKQEMFLPLDPTGTKVTTQTDKEYIATKKEEPPPTPVIANNQNKPASPKPTALPKPSASDIRVLPYCGTKQNLKIPAQTRGVFHELEVSKGEVIHIHGAKEHDSGRLNGEELFHLGKVALIPPVDRKGELTAKVGWAEGTTHYCMILELNEKFTHKDLKLATGKVYQWSVQTADDFTTFRLMDGDKEFAVLKAAANQVTGIGFAASVRFTKNRADLQWSFK